MPPKPRDPFRTNPEPDRLNTFSDHQLTLMLRLERYPAAMTRAAIREVLALRAEIHGTQPV